MQAAVQLSEVVRGRAWIEARGVAAGAGGRGYVKYHISNPPFAVALRTRGNCSGD